MSTVIPNDAAEIEENSSAHPAPKKVLKSTYEAVLAALDSNKRIILITGDAKKGKTTLIHTISKDISSSKRIINLSGNDLPSLDKSKSKIGDSELNNIKDFILESTDLDDTLVVTLDDANHLPVTFITDLAVSAKNSVPNESSMQLILSGPINFKEKLLETKEINTEDIMHCSLDSLNEEEIHAYAKNKSYKISSSIKCLEFKPDSLRALSDFAQADKQLLDVVLEWCAAISKKDQLNAITPHTVNRAAGFAQQFSKDKNLCLTNSYPPSHEVYKYINDIQSAKKSKKVKKKSVIKPLKNQIKNKANKPSKPFIQTDHKADNQATKIPTITTQVEKSKQEKPGKTSDKEVLETLKEIEEEILPPQWVEPARQNSSSRKSFPAMAGLLSILVVGFIVFIGYRIGSGPDVDPANKETNEQLAQNTTLDPAPVTASKTKIESEPKNEVVDKATVVEEKAEIAVNKQAPKVIDTQNKSDSAKMPKESVKTVAKNPIEKPEVQPAAAHKGIVSSDTQNATTLNAQLSKPAQADKKISDKNEEITKKTIAITTNKKPDALNTSPNKTTTDKKVSTKKENEDSTAAKVEGLLALANYQFKNKKMTTPAGDNALETYQKIIAKYPDNKEATAGIKKVHDKYVSWANYYLKQNEVNRAKHFYNKALSIDPSDTISKANLQNIARQEANNLVSADAPTNVVLQDAIPSTVIQNLLVTAKQKMDQIDTDIRANTRNYKVYQEAHTAYQDVLKSQPQNQQARQGLSYLKNHYTNWAELQTQNRNYNIALFLYGQALSIEPGDIQISQRIEKVRQLKQQAL